MTISPRNYSERPKKVVIARNVVTKPCPERSEGTLEIATGFALATTSSDCSALSCTPCGAGLRSQ